jgi:hypothetical protein
MIAACTQLHQTFLLSLQDNHPYPAAEPIGLAAITMSARSAVGLARVLHLSNGLIGGS